MLDKLRQIGYRVAVAAQPSAPPVLVEPPAVCQSEVCIVHALPGCLMEMYGKLVIVHMAPEAASMNHRMLVASGFGLP